MLNNIISFNQFINESSKLNLKSKFPQLFKLATEFDYNTFLSKTDSLTHMYYILYRGISDKDNIIADNSFFSDYIGHAKEYGDFVDGLIVNPNDILYFDDNIFNKLRNKYNSKSTIKPLSKKYILNIYNPYFKKNKLFDAMVDEYNDERSVINFVYKFINSNIPYSKVQKNKIKNDLLIPIMQYFAIESNYNIIQFVGDDYSDFGGADEFVVNDTSRYTKLSTIWLNANNTNK